MTRIERGAIERRFARELDSGACAFGGDSLLFDGAVLEPCLDRDRQYHLTLSLHRKASGVFVSRALGAFFGKGEARLLQRFDPRMEKSRKILPRYRLRRGANVLRHGMLQHVAPVILAQELREH